MGTPTYIPRTNHFRLLLRASAFTAANSNLSELTVFVKRILSSAITPFKETISTPRVLFKRFTPASSWVKFAATVVSSARFAWYTGILSNATTVSRAPTSVTAMPVGVTVGAAVGTRAAHLLARSGGGIAATAFCWTTKAVWRCAARSEEHTSELQSLRHLVCRLL